MSQYICIGVPYFIGEHHPERTEVAAIRTSGIAEELGTQWVDIQPDFSADVDPVIAINRALAWTIAARSDQIPLIFASCCTSALGALKGLESQKPAVLWYDAHGDFNTEETTPSGFLGGMPLAWLVGDGDQTRMQALNLAPVNASDIILTDARDLDPEEAQRVQASAMTHLRQVDHLLHYTLPSRPLYIHMDTDVVDISEMPGMSYPAAGGPSLSTVKDTAQYTARHAAVAGVLFSLWNDSMPTEGRSLTATLALVRAFTQLEPS
ncbi:MAG: arginase family protein [Chloroflexota bacterium]